MSWKICIAVIACLFPPMLAEASDELRVLCFNIRYINDGDRGEKEWSARRDAVAQVIRDDAPDLIGLQECLRPMLDDLHERLPGFIEIGGARKDGVAKGEASPIFARADRFSILESGTFWLSETPDVVGSASWGNEVVRICTWARLYDRKAGREVVFFNSHFDHKSDLARINGTTLILERIAEIAAKAPVIFSGDFNARPNHPLHQAIRASPLPLRDVWLELNPNAAPIRSGTIHAFTGRKDGPRIDFIYASEAFRFIEASIMQEPVNGIQPSDHYPVRATLGYPPR